MEKNTSLNSRYGLTSEQAQSNFKKFGPNIVVASPIESWFSEFKRVFKDPMGIMLLGLAAMYWILGNRSDALILLIAFIPVTAVDVVLDLRSRKALRLLRDTLKITTKVIRDGKVQEIETDKITIDDIVVFEEGQSLPADGTIIEAEHLAINEAALTGESVPIEKNAKEIFLGGTTVLKGRGLGIVEKIGRQTQFGKVASLLEVTEEEQSPLQKKVNVLVRLVVYVALTLAIALFTIELIRGKELVQSLIVAMTFGIAAIPEEFPLVFTLYLSLGAWRLSKHGVLVKSLPRVESLGGVDVICTDKTGTLTEGKFQLENIYPTNSKTVANELHWKIALMACEEKIVDSMEAAIAEKGKDFFGLLSGWKLKWDYPFDMNGKHMSHVWQSSGGDYIIAMKGAVEGVLEHCETSVAEKEEIVELTETFAKQGKRILGLAWREGSCSGQRNLDETNLKFLGLLVFNDPVRSSAKEAVAICQAAGISIKMLTGDHPLTAHAVADETGILHSHDYLFSGGQLEKMTKDQRWAAYLKGSIFSRVLPEQKHEMVQALKEAGNVVAMTGDGINDAPALKLADIGISMGVNATDVARSSAQMILLKNDFKGITEAVFEGRRILANLKKSFSYLVSFHIPVVLLALAPPLLGWGDLMLPIHIILLELIVHPISAFTFENLPAVNNIREKSLMSKRQLIEATLSGVVLSFTALVLFYHSFTESGLEIARTVALATVLFGNISLVFVESWPYRTLRLYITIFCLLALIFLFTYVTTVSHYFHFAPLDFKMLGLAAASGLISVLPTVILRKLNEESFKFGETR